MRIFPDRSVFTATACLILWTAVAPGVQADPVEPAIGQEALRKAAAREVELAELRLRRYRRVDFPLQMRALEQRATLLKAEIAALHQRLGGYDRIARGTVPDPLLISRQKTELALVAAELRLQQTGLERRLRDRYHRDQVRIYELELEEAKSRLDKLAR